MLIFGAGAHVPYDYPTSKDINERLFEIKDRVLGLLSKPSKFPGIVILDKNDLDYQIREITSLFERGGVIQLAGYPSTIDLSNEEIERAVPLKKLETFKNFLTSLTNADCPGLDDFLINYSEKSHNNHYYLLGKLLISYFIYQHELKPTIFKDDWIQIYLNSFFGDTFDEERIKKGDVHKIYTFNYDLLFERKIFKYIFERNKQANPNHAEQVSKLVDSIQIRHIYGSLQKPVSNSFDYYDERFREQNITKSAQQISLVRNGYEWGQKTQFQKDWDSCNQILFLGFSFNKTNLNTLFDGIKVNKKPCFSTNIELTKDVIKRINDGLRTYSLEVQFFENRLNQINCKTLIQERLL